jgi:hypothetical protein
VGQARHTRVGRWHGTSFGQFCQPGDALRVRRRRERDGGTGMGAIDELQKADLAQCREDWRHGMGGNRADGHLRPEQGRCVRDLGQGRPDVLARVREERGCRVGHGDAGWRIGFVDPVC